MYRILTLVAMLALAGCITPPESIEPASTVELPPTADGRMTGEESETRDSTICLDRGISLPDLQLQCATRVVTVEGILEIDTLPVVLTTNSGDIRVTTGEEGQWSLITTIVAGGATEDDARAKLDDVIVTWSIKDALGHKLTAELERTTTTGNGPRVEMVATLPPSVIYGITLAASSGDLVLEKLDLKGAHISASSGDITVEGVAGELVNVETSSGDITLADLKVDRLLAKSTSGDIEVAAKTGTATLASTSGDITAKLTPTKTGAYAISATSGDIELTLPESNRHGYDLSADVTSGDITISLVDGKTSGSEEHKRFQTDRLAGRDIRTGVAISSTSGDIDVGPGTAAGPLSG